MTYQFSLKWVIFSLTLSFITAGNSSEDLFGISRRYGVVQRNPNVNYERVLNFWKEHNKDFHFHDQLKDVVLVMGNTGSGKSTLVSALAGRKLRVTRSNGYLVIVDDEDRIGTGVSSKTLIPDVMRDSKRSVTYIDCAGFRDNRNLEYEIASLYFQNILLNKVDRIKLVFVINYESLKVNGNKNDFDDLLERISEFIKDISKFRDGIALVATKVENTYEENDEGNLILSNDDKSVLEGIGNYLKSKKYIYQKRTDNVRKYRMFVNLIDTLLQKNNQAYTRLAIFRQPTGQGLLEKLTRSKKQIDTITQMTVQELDYVKKQKDDFGFALSQSAKITVDQIIDDIFRNALTSRLDKMSNETITHYLQLEKQFSDIGMLRERAAEAYDLISRIGNVAEPKELFDKFLNVTNTLNISISLTNLNIISDDIKALNFFTTVSNTNEDIYVMLLKNKAQSVIDWIGSFVKIYEFLNNVHENLATYKAQKLKSDKRIQEIMKACESSQNKFIGDITNLESIVTEVGSAKIYQTIKTLQMNQVQLKILKHIFSGFSQKLESSCSSEQITVEGYNVMMKDVIEIDCFAQAKIVQIFALNKIFIDSSIDKTGKEAKLFIFAPTWEVYGGPKIKLDGTPAEAHKVMKAKSGLANWFNGKDGEPGLPGGSGGDFFGIGKQFINLDNLEIHANGGKGGPGQHGGDGGDGSPGKEIPESFFDTKRYHEEIETYLAERQFSHRIDEIKPDNYNYLEVAYIQVKYVIQVTGGRAKMPTNGGNGGSGGRGGYPGNIIINGLGNSVTFKVFNASGSTGSKGQGGIGGKGSHNGRSVVFKLSESFSYSSRTGCRVSDIKWTDGAQVPAAKDGQPGAEEKQKVPTTITMVNLPPVVNSYKAFVRKYLFENIKKSELMNLIYDMENDKQIKGQYNTVAFVKELDILENQSLELRSKIEFAPFYMSFLNRLEEFAKDEEVLENKKVLSYTYTAALTKLFTLKKKRKGKTVVNLAQYLSILERSLEDVRDAQNLKTVINYRNDYENTLRTKMREANDFIQNKIEPEINKLLEDSDNQVNVIVQEINVNQNSTEDAISSLEKDREKIRDMMHLRSMLLPLKLAATCLSFAGPVGAAVGATITGATSIAEGLVPNPTQGHKPVYSLDPNLKVMSRISEVLNNKPQLIADKVAVVVTTLDKQKEDLYTSQKEKIEISEKIGQLKVQTDEIKNRKATSISDIERRDKDVKKLEQEVNEFIETRKTVLGKEKAALDTIKKENKNAEQLKKDLKLETTLRRINHVQAALNSVEVVFGFLKKIQNDEGTISQINKQISGYYDQLKALENMRDQVYEIIVPDIRQMEATINAIKASINGSSHAKLDITKWSVRSSLGDIKSLLQKFTNKMSFEIQSNLKRYIEKIDEGFSILIDIYDRIDSYSDSVKQAEYMAHIVSTPMSDIHVKDTELSSALVDMKLIIQSNMLFEKYEIALQAFKQHYFPFAAHVLKRFQLPKGMQLKDIETLRSNIRNKIKDMKNHIDETESTLGEYSKFTHENNIFNSNTTGASPFYEWKYDAVKEEVQGLLNGSEILIKADITKALDYNSVKFTDIGLNFRLKNETLQNSFNSILKKFSLTMSMIGNNYYRCGEQYYFISFDDDITISYTLNQDETKNWINPNSVYTIIRKSHSFLSPYGLWSIKFKSLDRNAPSFDILKSFTNEIIDLELIGRGDYIEQDSDFNFNICNGYLDSFYSIENVAKELV